MTNARHDGHDGNGGFTMDRAPLRALAHAQGQLVHSHKDMLLFFALDTLVHLATSPQTQALKALCPEAFATAQTLGIYLVREDARKALLVWDVNAATRECRNALSGLAAACLEAGSNPEDCAAREQLAHLAQATIDYLDMAANIRHPDLTTAFQRASRINPFTSAAFIAAYMQRIGDDLQQRATKDNDCAALSAGFRDARQALEKMLPQKRAALHMLGQDKMGQVYELMDTLSAVADLARDTGKTAQRQNADDTRLAQALHYTFVTAAVYDWQQFLGQPEPANDRNTPPAKNNVLQFRFR